MADDRSFLDKLLRKNPGGFDPDVCVGCPYRLESEDDLHEDSPISAKMMKEEQLAALKPCDLCGCPTEEGFPMDRTGRPPDGCPRTEEHHRRG